MADHAFGIGALHLPHQRRQGFVDRPALAFGFLLTGGLLGDVRLVQEMLRH